MPKSDPGKWENGFMDTIHFLLLIGDNSKQMIDAEVDKVRNIISHFSEIATIEYGAAIYNKDGAGIEHFGYVDGVSQPLFFNDELIDYKNKNGIEKDADIEFNPSAELELVLVKDPLAACLRIWQ